MRLLPALDIKKGECVSVPQGRMSDAAVVSRDPVAQALAFKSQGFDYLHIVDLDGILAGTPINATCIGEIIKATALPVQIGGGVREMRTVETWIEKGVDRVILGTAAVFDPDFVRLAAQNFPGRVAISIDARGLTLFARGAATSSPITLIELAKRYEGTGVSTIIFTDLMREGMLQGLNIDRALTIADATTIPLIVAGGFGTMSDVKALLEPRARKIAGAIIGRALYEGVLDVSAALRLTGQLPGGELST